MIAIKHRLFQPILMLSLLYGSLLFTHTALALTINRSEGGDALNSNAMADQSSAVIRAISVMEREGSDEIEAEPVASVSESTQATLSSQSDSHSRLPESHYYLVQYQSREVMTVYGKQFTFERVNAAGRCRDEGQQQRCQTPDVRWEDGTPFELNSDEQQVLVKGYFTTSKPIDPHQTQPLIVGRKMHGNSLAFIVEQSFIPVVAGSPSEGGADGVIFYQVKGALSDDPNCESCFIFRRTRLHSDDISVSDEVNLDSLGASVHQQQAAEAALRSESGLILQIAVNSAGEPMQLQQAFLPQSNYQYYLVDRGDRAKMMTTYGRGFTIARVNFGSRCPQRQPNSEACWSPEVSWEDGRPYQPASYDEPQLVYGRFVPLARDPQQELHAAPFKFQIKTAYEKVLARDERPENGLFFQINSALQAGSECAQPPCQQFHRLELNGQRPAQPSDLDLSLMTAEMVDLSEIMATMAESSGLLVLAEVDPSAQEKPMKVMQAYLPQTEPEARAYRWVQKWDQAMLCDNTLSVPLAN